MPPSGQHARQYISITKKTYGCGWAPTYPSLTNRNISNCCRRDRPPMTAIIVWLQAESPNLRRARPAKCGVVGQHLGSKRLYFSHMDKPVSAQEQEQGCSLIKPSLQAATFAAFLWLRQTPEMSLTRVKHSHSAPWSRTHHPWVLRRCSHGPDFNCRVRSAA
jgi:hypothetical protein